MPRKGAHLDVGNPLRSVTPGVEADVLAVLDRTYAPLSGLRVAALAGRGETQVRTVLRRLEAHGVVEGERHGNSVVYVLNRDHLLAPAVHLMATAFDRLEHAIRTAVDSWEQPAEGVALFGSAARRDGDALSDIDLLVVRTDVVEADNDTWANQRHNLAELVDRLTGNRAQIVELSRSQLREAAASGQPLIGSLRDDAVIVTDPGAVLAGVLRRRP